MISVSSFSLLLIKIIVVVLLVFGSQQIEAATAGSYKSNKKIGNACFSINSLAPCTNAFPEAKFGSPYQKIICNSQNRDLANLPVTKGKLPSWLNADFFRNVPGRFSYGSDQIQHLFDGSANIHKFTLDGTSNKVTLKARFMNTSSFLHFCEVDKFDQLGAFTYPNPGPLFPSRHLQNKTSVEKKSKKPESQMNAVNNDVSFLFRNGRFYTTSDTNSYVEFDPETLSVPLYSQHAMSFNDSVAHSRGAVMGVTHAAIDLTQNPKLGGEYFNVANVIADTLVGRPASVYFWKWNDMDETTTKEKERQKEQKNKNKKRSSSSSSSSFFSSLSSSSSTSGSGSPAKPKFEREILAKIEIPKASYAHSMQLSSDWIIWPENPLSFSVAEIVILKTPPMRTISGDYTSTSGGGKNPKFLKKTKFHFCSRKQKNLTKTFTIEDNTLGWITHSSFAFDVPEQNMTIYDFSHEQDPTFYDKLQTEYLLQLKDGIVRVANTNSTHFSRCYFFHGNNTARCKTLLDKKNGHAEGFGFPWANKMMITKSVKYNYGIVSFPILSVVTGRLANVSIKKVDMESFQVVASWNPPRGPNTMLLTETIFFPRYTTTNQTSGGEEEDGILLTIAFDREREVSLLLGVDPRTMETEFEVDMPFGAIPFHFHGIVCTKDKSSGAYEFCLSN